MKFIFFPSVLILIINLTTAWSFSQDKELDLGVHKIMFSDKLNIINWNETNYASALCNDFFYCFGLVDNKALEVIEKLNSGKSYDDIKLIQPIVKKYKKLMNSFSESHFKR